MADIKKVDVEASFNNNIRTPAQRLGYSGQAPYGSGVGLHVNQSALVAFPPAAQTLTLSGNVSAANLITAARNAAKKYGQVVRALYGITGNAGGAYSAYNIFYVASGYHSAHYNQVAAVIDGVSTADFANSAAQLQDVHTLMQRLLNIVAAYKDSAAPDLRICHSSCHSNCHSSRGRR